MIYELTFLKSAKKEWDHLSSDIRDQFKKKLTLRLDNPVHEKDRLYGLPDCYKIKLRSVGYRLVYRVFSDRVVIQVVAVGKRDKLFVYRKAQERLNV